MNTNKNKKSETTKLFLTFVSSLQFRTTIFAHKSANKRKRKKQRRQKYCFSKSYVSVQGIFLPQSFLKPAIKNKKIPKFWYFFKYRTTIFGQKRNIRTINEKPKTKFLFVVLFCFCTVQVRYPSNVFRFSHFTSENYFLIFIFFFQFRTTKFVQKSEYEPKTKNRKKILFLMLFPSVESHFVTPQMFLEPPISH